MTSTLNPNHDKCLSFEKNRKTLGRDSVKQDTKGNQVFKKGKNDFTSQKGKNSRTWYARRERDGAGVQTWVLTTITCDP
jgi:hypothetical protein